MEGYEKDLKEGKVVYEIGSGKDSNKGEKKGKGKKGKGNKGKNEDIGEN